MANLTLISQRHLAIKKFKGSISLPTHNLRTLLCYNDRHWYQLSPYQNVGLGGDIKMARRGKGVLRNRVKKVKT